MIGLRRFTGLLAIAFLLCPAVVPAAESTPPPVLTKAAQIRQLSPDQAARHYRVRLRGVLTFFDQSRFYRFLQDDTAGIYLFPADVLNNPALATGELVEIEGETNPGEYAPTVTPTKVTMLGAGVFPAATPVTYEDLASGREDSQFIAVQGIVRAVNRETATNYYTIDVATGGGRLTALALQLPVERAASLVDSLVRIRGVCISQFNLQRQFFDLRLLVPHPGDIEIETPAPAEPFDVPKRSIEQLLQFAPSGAFGHRVKVEGTVIYRREPRMLYIQDQKEGLYVDTEQAGPLLPGEQVEVLGFPSRGEYTPMLQNAIFRKMSSGPVPVPDTVTVDQALRGTNDCRLVHIVATVLDRTRYGTEPFLILQAGNNFIFTAYMARSNPGVEFAYLKNGSEVALTGVCLIDPGTDWHPGTDWRAKSFRILLRSAGDILVLREPPWWTLEKMLWAVGCLVALVLVALAWVGILRRRVHKQTQIIRQKLDAEATMRRRYADLFENANDMVFTSDLAGRITSINATGETLLQQARDEILKHNLLDFIATEQRAAADRWLREVTNGSEAPTAEWDFMNPAGQRLRLEISARMVGKHEIEGIGRDITERNRLEKEILEISTREQQRIGHDLHDGVCQQLAGIAYRLDILSDDLEEKGLGQSAEADRIGRLITDTVNQTRGIARGLFPVRLETEGLVAALEELAVNAGNLFKLTCRFVCEQAPPEIEQTAAIHLYYIVQEAVVNAARHAQGALVVITLRQDQDRMVLMVGDNGPGFRLDGAPRTGMGIRIMRYRARVIGATLDLKSEPGKGTQLTCMFYPAPKPAPKQG